MREGLENKDGAKMSTTQQQLRILDEIGRQCLPGLVDVLREAVRYFLWNVTYDPLLASHAGDHRRQQHCPRPSEPQPAEYGVGYGETGLLRHAWRFFLVPTSSPWPPRRET
jgi:hypothetical protein